MSSSGAWGWGDGGYKEFEGHKPTALGVVIDPYLDDLGR
jgi:hypothetical protein